MGFAKVGNFIKTSKDIKKLLSRISIRWIRIRDPDPFFIFRSDPDPDPLKNLTDPKHWFGDKTRCLPCFMSN